MKAPIRNKLLAAAARAAAEAVVLADLGLEAIPLFKSAFEATGAILIKTVPGPRLLPVAGDFIQMDPVLYSRDYAASDPILPALSQVTVPVIAQARLPEWPAIEASAAYQEFYLPREMGRMVSIFVEGRHLEPGAVGILLSRSHLQPEFEPGDVRAIERVLPALRAAVRRSRIVERERLVRTAVESLAAEAEPRAQVALDAQGGLLWVSPAAERLCASWLVGRRELPEPLVSAARRLLASAAGDVAPERVEFAVDLARAPHGAPLRAELRLSRTRTGEPFAVAMLDATPPAFAALSPAERGVLELLALGLSNAEIARRLFVSTETVHSHLGRIYSKLGVRSRVQAVLAARRHG